MAQAAKQLKKIKDIEAQALQEQKEKEESNRKRRNRSRDRKKKVRGGRRRQPSGRGALEVAAGGRGSADLGTWLGPGTRAPVELLPLESAGRGVGEEEARGFGAAGQRTGQEAGRAERASRRLRARGSPPARPPVAETFQHLGQMPAGPPRSGRNFSSLPAAGEGDGLPAPLCLAASPGFARKLVWVNAALGSGGCPARRLPR